jgi:endoglycosylceramidase
MRQLVDDLYSHGIYTIVDFHQDSLSEQWCGEGVPSWMLPMLQPLDTSCDGIIPSVAALIGQCTAFKDFNIPTDPATGFPSMKGCLERTFDAYSRTPELVSAWGYFYGLESVQKKFQAYWHEVAKAFAGSPGVLGYDLINEPLNGNFFDDPERLLPGRLDAAVLQPMYQALYEVIKSADPAAIAMYEPPPFPDTYPSNIPAMDGVHPMGTTSGPAKKDVAHQALSYHIYSCGFAESSCNRQGDPPKADCPLCDQYASDAVSARDADRKRVGGGVFITEFGACSGSEVCISEINRITDQADSALHSWAYWQFKYYHDITTVSGPIEGFYKDNGELQTGKVAALSRTYAPAIAGHPQQMKFSAATGAFRLRYTTEEATQHLSTDIYLNKEMNYKEQGYLVSAFNATVKEKATNRLVANANAANLKVDIAIVRPYSGPNEGKFHSADGDDLTWNMVDSEDSPGFELQTIDNITWWKALYVYTDAGDLLCSLSTQDGNHGPVGCKLADEHKHDFLFGYRIELWKAKIFGKHEHVDTIESKMFGPLLKKQVKFTWTNDGGDVFGDMLKEVVV